MFLYYGLLIIIMVNKHFIIIKCEKSLADNRRRENLQGKIEVVLKLINLGKLSLKLTQIIQKIIILLIASYQNNQKMVFS